MPLKILSFCQLNQNVMQSLFFYERVQLKAKPVAIHVLSFTWYLSTVPQHLTHLLLTRNICTAKDWRAWKDCRCPCHLVIVVNLCYRPPWRRNVMWGVKVREMLSSCNCYVIVRRVGMTLMNGFWALLDSPWIYHMCHYMKVFHESCGGCSPCTCASGVILEVMLVSSHMFIHRSPKMSGVVTQGSTKMKRFLVGGCEVGATSKPWGTMTAGNLTPAPRTRPKRPFDRTPS